MSTFFKVPNEATIRLLPTTSAKDSIARLARLNSGQCHNLILTGIRGGAWNLAEFCSVIEAATHLAPQITTLDFSKMDLDETFLLFSIDLVNRCPNLKRLEMEENFFTDKAAEELGRALSTKKHLKYVNLTRCQLTDESAERFVHAVFKSNVDNGGRSENTAEDFFTSAIGFALHLSHNSLTSSFAKKLSDLVSDPQRHHLNTVSLFGNFIGNDESHNVHVCCQKRRALMEGKRRGAAGAAAAAAVAFATSEGKGKKTLPSSRTSLGSLVDYADESEKTAFPTVTALAKMLVEEEGL